MRTPLNCIGNEEFKGSPQWKTLSYCVEHCDKSRIPCCYDHCFFAADECFIASVFLHTSQISRESIDAVKNYFREDLQKTDWQLMIELKKIFAII